MKYRILLFSLLLLGILSLQNAVAQTIKVGVHGGVLFTNLNVAPTDVEEPEWKTQTSYQITVPVEIGLQGIFAIQPEMMYGTNGAQFNQTVNITEGGPSDQVTVTRHKEGWIRIQNLEIPVLAKVRFGSKNFNMHLLAGPAVGFGLSGKSRNIYMAKVTRADGVVTSEYMEDNTSDVVFEKDGYNAQDLTGTQRAVIRTSMNLHFGGGLDLNFGKMTAFLDGRYIFGLSDLFPEPEDAAAAEVLTAKSRRVGVSVGVLFALKG